MYHQFSIKKKSGFTLIELLITTVVIAVLLSIGIVYTNRASARSRDAKRVTDILNMASLIENYRKSTGSYPSTGSLNTVYMDPGCSITPVAPDQKTANWIPNLVPTYIGELPRDPNPGNRARNSEPSASCYLYASDGTDYILSAWASAEAGPFTSGQLYSRAGFREATFTDQRYYCNHVNIGNPGLGDYYQYSYTITNMNCTW